jgi:hypothetical protein
MKGKKNIFLALGIIAILLPAVLFSGVEKGKVDISLKLKQGQTYNELITIDQKISQEAMGTKQDISQTVEFVITLKTKKVESNGDMTVDFAYKSIKFKQESAGGKIEFDSANPPKESNPVMKVFTAMVGKNVEMIITSNGKVKPISGLEKITSGLMEVSGAKEVPEQNAIKETIDKNFSDESFSSMIKNFAGMLPEKPVSIGESWSVTSETSKDLPMIISTTNTLKSVKGGKAIVGLNGTVKPNPKSNPSTMGNMKMNYDMTGAQSGDIEIDLATGLMTGGEMKQDINGKVIMESTVPPEKGKEEAKTDKTDKGKTEEAKKPESMSVPISIKSVIKCKAV